MIKYLLCLLFLGFLPCLPAQTTPSTALPEVFTPLLREIMKTKTPAQWLETIQTTSPTAGQIIQKRAREPKPKGFALADFEALPKKDQKALIETFTPLVTQALRNLSAQEQLALIAAAPEFEPDQVISPIFNHALGLVR
jgi:hypothetical protein